MALKQKTCVVGMVQTNCYIVYDDSEAQAGRCILIDPGAQPDRLMDLCKRMGRTPVAILLTHGHFDHIMAVPKLQEVYGSELPVYALKEEAVILEHPAYNLSASYGCETALKGVRYLEDGAALSLLGHTFEVIATPGHTPGGCCYYVADSKMLFAGDTLFYESCGRTDFPYGNMGDIVRSIAERLLVLPDDVMVYPGHGADTDIAHEKQYNFCVGLYQQTKKKEQS